MGISRLSVRIVILLLLIGGSTLTYFLANQEKFKPNDEFYVQYDEEDIKDLQLNYRIDELNGYTLRQVFEEILTNWNRQLPNGQFTYQQRLDNGAYVLDRYVAEYTLVAGDINNYVTTNTNNDVIQIYLANMTGVTQTQNANQFRVLSYQPRTTEGYDSIEAIGKMSHYIVVPARLELFVVNGAYANLSAAQTALAGTKIWYQLAMPILNVWTYDITVEEMDQYYQMYLDILDGQRIIHEPLAKLDSQGRDYYHVSMDDYEMLGSSGVVDFKQLLAEDGPISTVSKVMEGVSSFFRYTIGKIDGFIQGYLDLMQNLKKFVTGWFS